MRAISSLVLSACILWSTSGCSEESPTKTATQTHTAFTVETVISNLGMPWGLSFVDSKTLLFTERSGKVGKLDLETGDVHYLDGVPEITALGQGGLLDIVVYTGDKDSAAPNPWVYFTYSLGSDDQAFTTLGRAKLNGDTFTDWQHLFKTKSAQEGGRHFGSRIAFDQQGHLFFSVGDRGHRPNGQDTQTHAGSILRLNTDGSLPSDNPWSDSDANVLKEIWSYGHRNPQGLVYDQATERLWSIEHGPRGGDELNLIQAKGNYGWAKISFGKEYWGPVDVGEGTEHPGMIQPVKQYTPSIAPSSLMIYRGEAFPQWQGNLFSGALKLTHLNRIVLDEAGNAIEEERLLNDMNERIRALVTGPEGFIYFSTDSGKIMRIQPSPTQ